MRISFDLQKTEQQKNTCMEKSSCRKSDKTGAASFLNRQTVLDISGKVTDDFGYNGKVIQDVGVNAYMALQRNFNAVMSNSMSGRDFMEMDKEGFDVYSMEPEEAVNILDKIKTVLAQSGTEIAGFNDDLSAAELEEITGSSGYARSIERALKKADAPVTRENIRQVEEALEQALSLKGLGEGNIAYLLGGGLEPTLSNLYKASYSSVNVAYSGRTTGYASGSYGRQGENVRDIRKTEVSEADYTRMQEQIEQRVKASGLTADQENIKRAQWLMEKGIPVSGENIELMGRLEQLSFPLDAEIIINQAARALGEGRSVWDIPVQKEAESIYRQAVDYYERYQKLPIESADYAVETGLSLSLENMEGYYRAEGNFTIQLQARKTLEEVRLKMTVEANLKLIQSGFSIDTAPMEELIGRLDEAARQWQEALFGKIDTTQKSEIFTQTLEQIRELPRMPLALAGKLPFMDNPTLKETGQEGRLLQSQYRAANESYETLMTAPRADLGDSIGKAFRNVDDILQEMNLEVTEESRRAVRILGYNRMEITEENLWRVQEADRQVRDVITGMKPGLTLEMIRQGKNPLEMTLNELQNYIMEKDAQFGQDTSKYSKFLYKMEQKGEISAKERKAYIGIYRLFRQIEKSDGAAVGSLVAQGADLNFSNLLSAVRSRKAKGTDIRVDDAVGTLSRLEKKGISISDQIEEGINQIRQDLNGDMSLKQLIREMKNIAEDEELEERFAKESLEEIRQILEKDGTQADYLKTYNQPVTIDHLQSAGVLNGQRGRTFRQIKTLEENFLKKQEGSGAGEETFGILEKAEAFIDTMDQLRNREEAYQSIIEEAGQALENAVSAMGDEAGYVDIKGIQQLYKQLNLAADLSREENYEIPVQIGEEVTSINLKIIHNSETTGEVKITLDTEKLGKVEARFRVSMNALEGSILTEYMDKKELLWEQSGALTNIISEVLEETGIELKGIFFGENKNLNINGLEPKNNVKNTDTALLYKIAKGFITFIRTR